MKQEKQKTLKFVNRKSMVIRYSGRSSDYITPSFGYGCLLDCTYCYMKRHLPEGVSIALNPGDILTAVNNHVYFDTFNLIKPNQTDPDYITYDISCNEDFALHHKYHDWKFIFKFFKEHDLAKATFATKIIPTEFLSFNPNKKVRIRFSLMPQRISDLLEPNTPKIIDRIKAVDAFIDAGYEVHLNFSPVIFYDLWEKDYEELFQMINDYVDNKDEVLAEVIMLTHNAKKHFENLKKDKKGEFLLWTPNIQESKTSSYDGENLRYRLSFKQPFIDLWKDLHDKIIPWNTIRYIF